MEPVTSARRTFPGYDVIIVGAGLGGLTAAHTIAAKRPDASIVVLEATDRAGGQIVTTTAHGYTFEHSATSLMLRGGDEASLLVDRLGLRESVRQAEAAGTRGFFYTGGTLRAVPRSPREAAASSLLSMRGKLRALAEPLSARPRHDGDETVYEFAARRFGDEFARVIATTAVQGVTGGDARTTSLRAVFPALHDIDVSAGRLGLVTAVLRARASADRMPRDARRRACTFRNGGLQVLVDTLARDAGYRIRYGARVRELQHSGPHYAAVLASGEVVEARHVVVALPALHAGPILRELAPDASAALEEIRYVGLRVIGLGYPRAAFRDPVQGLGFLVPPGEGRGVLGTIISSNLFPEQAPSERVLVRGFVGGGFAPEIVDEPRDLAIRRVENVLSGAYGLCGEPDFVCDARWPEGIPQYEPVHTARLEQINRALAPHRELRLVGVTGVGLPAVIRSATNAGRSVAAALPPPDDRTVRVISCPCTSTPRRIGVIR